MLFGNVNHKSFENSWWPPSFRRSPPIRLHLKTSKLNKRKLIRGNKVVHFFQDKSNRKLFFSGCASFKYTGTGYIKPTGADITANNTLDCHATCKSHMLNRLPSIHAYVWHGTFCYCIESSMETFVEHNKGWQYLFFPSKYLYLLLIFLDN